MHTVGVNMFAGSSASYDEIFNEKSSVWGLLSRHKETMFTVLAKVLGIRIDDTSFPLLRALDWLERQLLRAGLLVSRFIWRRRRGLQGEFIFGKMSGNGYDER